MPRGLCAKQVERRCSLFGHMPAQGEPGLEHRAPLALSPGLKGTPGDRWDWRRLLRGREVPEFTRDVSKGMCRRGFRAPLLHGVESRRGHSNWGRDQLVSEEALAMAVLGIVGTAHSIGTRGGGALGELGHVRRSEGRPRAVQIPHGPGRSGPRGLGRGGVSRIGRAGLQGGEPAQTDAKPP